MLQDNSWMKGLVNRNVYLGPIVLFVKLIFNAFFL